VVPGAQNFNHDTSAIIPGLSVSDADGNLSTTQLSVAHGMIEIDLAGGAVIASGASGSNALTLSGSQAQINAALGTLRYKGDSKYVGLDSLSVLSTDGDGNNDADEVLINVNNTAPVAADLFVETNQNQSISGTLAASDAESDPIQFAAIGDEFPVHGTLVINQNGTYTYTPDLNFVGLDSFNYSVEDNANGVSQYTVTVTVNAVNQPPTGENVITSTNEDVELTEYFPVAVDPEGNNPIVYAILVPPSHGEVTINEVDFDGTYYTYTYKPNLNYNGPDSFQYVARDSLGNESIYTVTIDVKSANDAPTSEDKTLTIEEDDPYVFGLADFAFNDAIESNT
jgi:VCBS repeat-containing protein